jgi:Fe-S oxidoreductase
MHTTEFLIEQGFDMNLKSEETTVTYHDPCRLGRQMGIYEEPRELINAVEGVEIVEMEHSGEDAMCCGVSSMMSCNENARSLPCDAHGRSSRHRCRHDVDLLPEVCLSL